MVTKEQLLELLPIRNQAVLTDDRQNTDDIRELILTKHREYAKDYDLISHYFDTGNIVDTSRQIFDFLKTYVPYKKENGRFQTVKSPALILLSNEGNNNFDRVDCKNYASFIAGVIDSIKRQNPNSNWDWTYRFASYEVNDPEPGHVFVVVMVDGKELWIDPVFTYFNSGDMHEWELDEKPVKGIGGLYSISGPDVQSIPSIQTVTVNKQVAWTSFLYFVSQNIFAVRDLLIQNPLQTQTMLKSFCNSEGYDYDQLMRFIKYSKE